MSIIISDKSQVLINSIKQNLSNLCIVADFDWTLTQYFDEQGHSRPSIISLLRDEWVLDEDYSIKAKEMYTKYSAIEQDKSLPIQVRHDAMNERWTTHKELLITKWLTKQDIDHIVSLDKMMMRSWTSQLLQRAHNNQIPIIIFSASGIGMNMIQLLLERRWLMLENIHIISNELYRDTSWHMIWYSTPIIHSLNKQESVLHEPQYSHIHRILEDKTNFIVIGDGLSDADMIDKRDDRTILKVGLCNDKVKEKLSDYQSTFDIVITHDQWFEELVAKIS